MSGKELIRNFYQSQMASCKFEEFQILSMSVCDSIAVEKGRWTVSLESGGGDQGGIPDRVATHRKEMADRE